MCDERWALHVGIKRKFFLHFKVPPLISMPMSRIAFIGASCNSLNIMIRVLHKSL